MSGFVKLYGSILDSSVWGESLATRVVWVALLAMADASGFVEAAVPGLARRANVSLAECESALAVLMAPDPHSKSPEFEGRRLEKVDRGWLVLNYESYRELRTESQVKKAARQARWRAGNKTSTVDDVDAGETEVSASASAVGSSQEKELQSSVGKEGPEDVYAFVGEFDFGTYADAVVGLLKVQRYPYAVIQHLRQYLHGEGDYEKATPRELGLACLQYLPSADRWNSSYFDGFVRRAKGKIRGKRETETIDREQREKREREREDAEAAASRERRLRQDIEAFGIDHPDRYDALVAEAERRVTEPNLRGRKVLVKAELYGLIREELQRAESH